MKVYTITMGFMDLPLLRFSLEQYRKTTKGIATHILVLHHWPLSYWEHAHAVLDLAKEFNCRVMAPFENLGGHGGINWTIKNLPLKPGDLVIGYDGDSNPQTPGWDELMVRAMEDQSYGAVSLSIDGNLLTKEWAIDVTSSGVEVKRPANGIEMTNVTMWRADFLLGNEFSGPRSYYGLIEGEFFSRLKAGNLKHGYLTGAYETNKPFEPHPEYQAWKAAHVGDLFKGNFDEWCESRGLR